MGQVGNSRGHGLCDLVCLLSGLVCVCERGEGVGVRVCVEGHHFLCCHGEGKRGDLGEERWETPARGFEPKSMFVSYKLYSMLT